MRLEIIRRAWARRARRERGVARRALRARWCDDGQIRKCEQVFKHFEQLTNHDLEVGTKKVFCLRFGRGTARRTRQPS